FSSRRRHTRFSRDWSSDVCSSDLPPAPSDRIGGRDPLVRGSKKKGAESRIKRIEETMAKLNARKSSIESSLARPDAYTDPDKVRSEERRVGKEWRTRRVPEQ